MYKKNNKIVKTFLLVLNKHAMMVYEEYMHENVTIHVHTSHGFEGDILKYLP